MGDAFALCYRHSDAREVVNGAQYRVQIFS